MNKYANNKELYVLISSYQDKELTEVSLTNMLVDTGTTS